MRTIIDDIYNVEFFGDLTSGIQEVIEPYADSYPNILPFFNTGDYFEYNVHNYLDGPYGDYCGITSTLEPRLQYLLGHNQISKVAPEIYFVNQDISEPEPGEQVVITAAVTGAESVELMVQNQALNGQFFSIEMYDDGNSGDGNESDIIYGATIPFNSSGDQVRYYIRASNDDALVLEPRQAEWEYYHFVVGNVLADTNIVINGSIIYFSECEVHYITQCLKHLLENQLQSLDVKAVVHDDYNKRIDEGNQRMAWGLSDVNSWYKNASGRTAQNWPFSLLEYWEQTRDIKPSDYHMT